MGGSTVAGGVARGGGWMNRSPWRLEEVDGSPWRLEEVDGGDEQYPVESRFAVRRTPPDEQDPRFDRSAPTKVRFLRFAVCHTPPDQQGPVSTVGGPREVMSTTQPSPCRRCWASKCRGL